LFGLAHDHNLPVGGYQQRALRHTGRWSSGSRLGCRTRTPEPGRYGWLAVRPQCASAVRGRDGADLYALSGRGRAGLSRLPTNVPSTCGWPSHDYPS
jgi:hypothetical protein